MVTQKFVVKAVNLVRRSVVQGGHAVAVEVVTAEVRASPTPLPSMESASGWSANTPTLDIQFSVWGSSVPLYLPGFTFELTMP